MKGLLKYLAGIICLLGSINSALATPYLYTFEGYISRLSDNTGIVGDAGKRGGSGISYTFLVDLELDGYIQQTDTLINNYTDMADTDYFYTELVDSEIKPDPAELYTVFAGTQSINLGVDKTTLPRLSRLWGGNGYHNVSVGTGLFNFSDWTIGTHLIGSESIYSALVNDYSRIYSELRLTAIDEVTSVPEPSALLLLGAGLIVLRIARKEQKSGFLNQAA